MISHLNHLQRYFPIIRAMWFRFSAAFLVGTLAGSSTSDAEEPKPVTFGIEAEDFSFQGEWQIATDKTKHSGHGFLFAGPAGAKLPAAAVIKAPKPGKYHLWVRALDFPDYLPGKRTLTVSVQGKKSPEIFGDSGREGFQWEPGGTFDLPAGEILIGIHDLSKNFARVDAILLTTDEKLEPRGNLGSPFLPRVAPIETRAKGAAASDPFAAWSVKTEGAKPAATLENEFVRFTFVEETCDDTRTIFPKVEIRHGDRWRDAKADAAAEIYSVVLTKDIEIGYTASFPLWKRASAEPVELDVNGAKITTARSLSPPEIWRAGEFFRFRPVAAEKTGDAVRLRFEENPAGSLRAEWRLPPGQRAANLKLTFTPTKEGSCSLGYHLFFRRPIDAVEELQLPLAFQRKRLPDKAYVLLDPRTPTPLSLAQTGKGTDAVSWAVIGDPAEIPFAWPDREKPHMGFCIRDEAGNVQPAIYGPVPGTERAAVKAGKPVEFRCRVLVQAGDWYAGYRTAADDVFDFRDYRRNGRVSLSDAVMNVIDLIKDDEFGGWWRRAKGWYQIESHNTVSHAAPATMLSLYRLTGDRDIYRRRALPTMEYILSRGSVHFTPAPHDPGRYSTKPMGGPCAYFGSSTYATLSRLTGGYTPAFEKIGLPAEEKVRPTVGYGHPELFNEWAARYRVTGDDDDLRNAIRLADEYLEKKVLTAPTRPVGHSPFWLISFVPDWEGLLMMYELTGEKRFLNGAALGARQLMTGLWTQPVFPEGDTTIFPGDRYEGDPWNGHLLARGPYEARLGFPLRDDSLREHTAPAWAVSCVGLGFEQPSTLGSTRNRLIYQAVWAPEFLRLARHTGDKAFETCARNATVGRWANYPGYYVSGHNDLVMDPAYPFVGPDQSVIYYHHIVPHLSWTLDYLVADAELCSKGKIEFPWLRENGYAYFDGKVFGHEPGRIFGETDCWLWLQRGAVQVSNPQINLLAAHNEKKFFAILVNQDTRPQTASVTLSQQALGIDAEKVLTVTARRTDGARKVDLIDGRADLEFAPRELIVIEVEGAHIAIDAHRIAPPPAAAQAPTEVELTAGDVQVRAAAIAVEPGPWDAFIWCDALPGTAASVTLETEAAGQWTPQTDAEYPFEFSVPMDSPEKALRFRVRYRNGAGEEFSTPEATLGAIR